jgi:transposase
MFNLEHKIFLTESYFKNAERQQNGEWKYSIQHCAVDFQNAFPDFPVEYPKLVQLIYKCVEKFRNIGTVGRKAGSGAPKKRTPEVVADVAARMQQSPTKSLRRLAQETELSYGTCQKILKKDLDLRPYKIMAVQELLPRDFGIRVEYCQWFLNHLNNNNTLDLTFFTDETWFHLSGYINKQNMRIWSAENPRVC